MTRRQLKHQRKGIPAIRSEAGSVLPLTVMILVLLASLTAAFATLSTSEPQIALNLRRGSEALGLAEAGMEEAIWALSNPTRQVRPARPPLAGLTKFPH